MLRCLPQSHENKNTVNHESVVASYCVQRAAYEICGISKFARIGHGFRTTLSLTQVPLFALTQIIFLNFLKNAISGLLVRTNSKLLLCYK